MRRIPEALSRVARAFIQNFASLLSVALSITYLRYTLCRNTYNGILFTIAVRVKRAMRALSIARNMVHYTMALAVVVVSHTLFFICLVFQ